MENHSYDNYLGMLPDRGEGFPLDGDGQPVASNPDADGEPDAGASPGLDAAAACVPSQSWHASHHQWDEGKNDGFVTSNEVIVPAAGDVDPALCQGAGAAVGMGYWTEDDLPVLLRPGPDLPGRRPLVQLLPGTDLPQPPLPHRRDRARPDRRRPQRPARLPAQRDDLRPAGPATASRGPTTTPLRATSPGSDTSSATGAG